MFGIFKRNKKTESGKNSDKAGQSKSREELKAEALANARKARETIGEENIQKLAKMLKEQDASGFEQQAQAQAEAAQKEQTQQKLSDIHVKDPGTFVPKQGSPAEQAIKIISEMDQGDVADKLREMIQKDKLN